MGKEREYRTESQIDSTIYTQYTLNGHQHQKLKKFIYYQLGKLRDRQGQGQSF